MAEFDYRDVLLKAASYVEEGWIQSAFHQFKTVSQDRRSFRGLKQTRVDPLGSCAVGAIDRAAIRLGLEYEHAEAAVERLARSVKGTDDFSYADDEIVEWNDTPGRTSAEVAEALRRAAE